MFQRHVEGKSVERGAIEGRGLKNWVREIADKSVAFCKAFLF